MAKQLSGVTQIRIKNTSSGGAVGTSYSALIAPTEDLKLNISDFSTQLGSGQNYQSTRKLECEFSFVDFASSNATRGNVVTDIQNNVFFDVEITTIDAVVRTITSVYLLLSQEVTGKAGDLAKHTINFQKVGADSTLVTLS